MNYIFIAASNYIATAQVEKFKRTAEEMGKIKVERHKRYGWTISRPSQETLDFCKRHRLGDIQIWRQDEAQGGKTKKPSSTRKYICPCCGSSFRATKDINVLCMDCNEIFVKTE